MAITSRLIRSLSSNCERIGHGLELIGDVELFSDEDNAGSQRVCFGEVRSEGGAGSLQSTFLDLAAQNFHELGETGLPDGITHLDIDRQEILDHS